MTKHPMFGRRASEEQEDGFTLVELMVVVLVIGILLAIAIPTFLGARSRAQDGSAKASLRNAQTAAGVIYTDDDTYAGANQAALTVAEPSLVFVASPAASTDPEQISVSAGANWGGAARSDSDTCFFIYIQANGQVLYGSADATVTACTGANAATVATDPDW